MTLSTIPQFLSGVVSLWRRIVKSVVGTASIVATSPAGRATVSLKTQTQRTSASKFAPFRDEGDESSRGRTPLRRQRMPLTLLPINKERHTQAAGAFGRADKTTLSCRPTKRDIR